MRSASTVQRSMLATGAVQALLLAPSLVLSVVGLAALPVAEYAAWALLFALGSAAIVLDFGAFQLAQIKRAEGRMSVRELAQLFAQASVMPVMLTVSTSLWWDELLDTFVDHARPVGAGLPLLLGVAALVRAWQNVANGILVGAGQHRERRRGAASGAVAQLFALFVLFPHPSSYDISVAYLVGGAIGLIVIAKQVHGAIGPSPIRGPNHLALRSTSLALGAGLTQLDRLLVGSFASTEGLAAYDFAARLTGTTKLGCTMVAAGSAAQGAQAVTEGPGFLGAAQHFIDRLAGAAFAVTPAAVFVLAAVARPGIAPMAAALALILAAGHGLNATTAPLTGYLSGLRRPLPELTYVVISVVLLAILAWPLGQLLGVYGVAAAVSLSLACGSVWLRVRLHQRPDLLAAPECE